MITAGLLAQACSPGKTSPVFRSSWWPRSGGSSSVLWESTALSQVFDVSIHTQWHETRLVPAVPSHLHAHALGFWFSRVRTRCSHSSCSVTLHLLWPCRLLSPPLEEGGSLFWGSHWFHTLPPGYNSTVVKGFSYLSRNFLFTTMTQAMSHWHCASKRASAY